MKNARGTREHENVLGAALIAAATSDVSYTVDEWNELYETVDEALDHIGHYDMVETHVDDDGEISFVLSDGFASMLTSDEYETIRGLQDFIDALIEEIDPPTVSGSNFTADGGDATTTFYSNQNNPQR